MKRTQEKQYKVISFDMFLTLVDVNDQIPEIWNAVLPTPCSYEQALFYSNEMLIEYATIMKDEMMKPNFISMKNIFQVCATSMVQRTKLSISPSSIVDSMFRAHRNAPLYEDVTEIFDYLAARYKIIISSDSDVKMCNCELKKLDIAKVYTSEDLQIYKNNPHRKFFEPILQELNISPDEIVHIGDSYSDFTAASNSGIDFIWLNREGIENNRFKGANHIIHSLVELKGAL